MFVFPVDADDYINCHVSEYVNSHPDAYGFKSREGWRWVRGRKWMESSPYYGGSMNIMKLKENEMPDILPDVAFCYDKDTCVKLNAQYPIRWTDIEVEGKFKQMGRELSTLPFYSTIYVLGTGENLSVFDSRYKSDGKFKIHMRLLFRKVFRIKRKWVTSSIKDEFGME